MLRNLLGLLTTSSSCTSEPDLASQLNYVQWKLRDTFSITLTQLVFQERYVAHRSTQLLIDNVFL